MKAFFYLTVILVVLAVAGLYWGTDYIFSPAPPPRHLSEASLESGLTETPEGQRAWQGCYTFRREGLKACYVSGHPEVRGAALGIFLAAEFKATEKAIQQLYERTMPNRWLRWFAFRLLAWQQSRLAVFLSPEIRQEILGFTRTTANAFPLYGSYYHRLVQLQELYDMTHAGGDEIRFRGTAIGLAAERTKEQGVFLAHNFDCLAGDAWDQNKVVCCLRPDNGYAFLSITWPGQFGVVSGMNEAGLGVAVLAVSSAKDKNKGLPVSLAARRILTEAADLRQAVALLQEMPIMVRESFVLGSGGENSFVVVEKSPEKTVVRKMQNGYIAATDYFLAPDMHPEDSPAWQQGREISLARLRRVKTLLRKKEEWTVSEVVEMLRDRQGEFGEPLGWGHRSAINALTAVHSVVFDLKHKRAWVAAAPHQLGKYVPFDLQDFGALPPADSIPADPILASGKYNEYLVYRHGLREAALLYQGKKYQESLAWLQEVRPLNPLDYQNYLLAGKALQKLGRVDEAGYNYQQAKRLHPAFFWEKVELEKHLENLRQTTTDMP
ncbi:hypothetical protein JW933_03695 [candidate division FCPU426 bacterium]|nr:hypothetical protein [candidate division FCPU426 bacterium]